MWRHMLPNQSCTAFPSKKVKKAQVLNPVSVWVSKTPSLCSSHLGKPVLGRSSFVRTFLSSCLHEGGVHVLCDRRAGRNHKWNKRICMLPTKCVHFTSSRALGNNGNVFSATMINGITSSGAVSDLPGLAINLYTELRIFTLATSFLMLFWGALAIHFIRAMFLFLFLYLNDWLSKNYNIQLSSSLEINSLKMSPILLQSTRYFWQLFTCLLLIFPLNQLPIGI